MHGVKTTAGEGDSGESNWRMYVNPKIGKHQHILSPEAGRGKRGCWSKVLLILP